MVCIYCSSPTSVSNSRLQSQANETWRRRRCSACKAIFTTYERAALEGSVVVQYSQKDLRPFQKEQLFLDIYNCCKHLPDAVRLASELTRTIAAKLVRSSSQGILTREEIIGTCSTIIGRVDKTAAAIYQAYHPKKL